MQAARHTTVSVLAVAIKFLQLLIFPLQEVRARGPAACVPRPPRARSPRPRVRRAQGVDAEAFPAIVPLREVAGAPSIGGWIHRAHSPGLYFALFIIAVAWVAVYLGLQLWALLRFAHGDIPVIWPLKALRTIANVSATVAFIPLFILLVTPFQCGDPLLPPVRAPAWGFVLRHPTCPPPTHPHNRARSSGRTPATHALAAATWPLPSLRA